MAQKKGYDVLRFISHGKGSYISSTYVEGVTLFQWLSETPRVKKSDCIAMIHEIAKQLELLHKSKGNPVYHYVNPYCIVLSEDKNIYLIDMKAESSGERLRKMQSRKIRERFLPVKDPFYQDSSIQTDLFGFGRTLQYMMAAVQLSLPLTKREERQIKNVINRCLAKNPKKTYESIAEVRKHLPHVKEEGASDEVSAESGGFKRKVFFFLLLILLVVAGIYTKEYLGKSQEEAAVLTEEDVPKLECEAASELECEAASDIVMEPEEKESELFNSLNRAQSLETLGRYLEAADLYEEILISLDNVQEKEVLYEKTASLYMKLGNYDKAYEILQFGMSELVPSDYLWTVFLNLLTNNEEISDEQKLTYVHKFTENNTEYEKKKYQKILAETDFYRESEEKEEQDVETLELKEKESSQMSEENTEK